MATPVLMPKQGQSVETCNLLKWRKAVGDAVAQGEILCEVETDKATFEVESPAAGTLLVTFAKEGDDVPVLTHIAVIGHAGEATDSFRPEGSAPAAAAPSAPAAVAVAPAVVPVEAPAVSANSAVSPRARRLAAEQGVAVAGLAGSGPQGRIIERDVKAALAAGQPLTPAAQAAAQASGATAPASGSGIGGRVTVADLQAKPAAVAAAPVPASADEVVQVPVKGIRKLIAERMLASLTTTAQLTLNSSADASAVLAYRQKLKASPEALGVAKITVNDLVLFVVARTLAGSPEVNAIYQGGVLYRHKRVHLAFAVDTPRGLMVPVIRDADRLTLKQLSVQTKRLATACVEGKINPDDLSGGTFTVTNLGNLGIESFTPVLNPPQVAILGVSTTQLKPVEVDGEVKFIPHLGLSLTIDHQVVDGAPGARFLQALANGLANLEVMLAG